MPVSRLSPFRSSLLSAPLLAALAAFTVDTDAQAQITTPAIPQAVPFAARPLPLDTVRLTGGPLKHAQDLDADYLLKLEPDRMLHHLRERAGLPPKTDSGYGGWDGGGRTLTGHIAGHYLSAVSLMYSATGDARFKERADYVVAELKLIQDAQGDGYIGGLQAEVRRDGEKVLVDGKTRFEDLGRGVIESGGFDLNGMWSPWYVQHKLYAGLRDAYRHTGNKLALEVEVKFAEWADGILSKLDVAQIQKMLGTEFGAMNEIMADLYADTGDERWRRAYRYFEHLAFVDPLAEHRDVLPGTHGNTQVPKLYGDLVFHLHTGEEKPGRAARFFWDVVVDDHSFATGGHGKDEYFGPPDQLNHRVDGRTAETCNVYNMLKFSRTLFALQPDAKYAEFHERALFNHILASIDPQDGRTCYMVPVGRGVTREYQDMFQNFTCCVGTGMESHALHGDGLFLASPDGTKLWVNLYAPSTATWAAQGLRLSVATEFPEGEDVALSLALPEPRRFALALRRPAWVGEGFAVSVNGEALPATALAPADGYVEIAREWRDGDRVELRLPKTLRAEPVPDNPGRVALLWGPLVLAGDLGPEDRKVDARTRAPVFVTDAPAVADWLKPVEGRPGVFRSDGVGREHDVEFMPLYRLHRRTYAVYWDLFTTADWAAREAELARENERRARLEAATVAFVQPGEMQPERDFNQQGEGTSPYRVMGRAGRRGTNWFSFDVPVDASRPSALVVTYWSDEWSRRRFEILVDGRRIAEQTVEKGGEPRFFDVTYPVPAELVAGKERVTIRFQAVKGHEIAAVYGLRSVRADLAAEVSAESSASAESAAEGAGGSP